MKNFTAMTIAGSDSSGGAGIQADLKTFFAFGVYGASAITALTVQNTQGVTGVSVMTPTFVKEQIEAIISDIPMNAVKTGMLAEENIVKEVAEFAKQGKLKNLVVDPVMISKSGHSLLSRAAMNALIDELVPNAYLITPNAFEAQEITGLKIDTIDGLKKAAEILVKMGAKNAVIKGGHLDTDDSTDVFFNGNEIQTFSSPRKDTPHTHGTGCTFASAVTACLARGMPILESVSTAKKYISAAIDSAPGLGHGHGPVDHFTLREGIWP